MKLFVVNSIFILTILVFLQVHEETNAEALANHYRMKNRHDDDKWNHRKHSHSDEESDESDEDEHKKNKNNQPTRLPSLPPPSKGPPSKGPPSKGPPPVKRPPMETQIPRPQIFPPYGLNYKPGFPSGNQEISENIGIYGSSNSIQQISDQDTHIIVPITVQQHF